MADTRYIIDADVNPALRGIDKLNKEVGGLNETMSKFGKILGGLAIGSFIRNALQAANVMTDLAASTNLTTQSVVAFSTAMQENSGSAESARTGLLTLNRMIGQARSGTLEAKKAFEGLGISMLDLRLKSPDEILRAVLESLGNVGSASERAAIAMKLLGEEAARADLGTIAGAYDTYVAKAANYSSAVTSAGKANQQLKNAVQTLQLEILKAIQPITDFTSKLDPETINSFISSIVSLGKALVALYAFSRLGSLFLFLGKSTQKLGTFFSTLKAKSLGLYKTATGGLSVFGNLRWAFSALFGTLGAGLPLLTKITGSFKYLGLAIRGAFLPLAIATAAFYALDYAVKQINNGGGIGAIIDDLLNFKRVGDEVDYFIGVADKVPGTLQKFNKEAKLTREELEKTFGSAIQQQIQNIDDYIGNINLKGLRRELDLINNVAEQDRPLQRQLGSATDAYAEKIRELNQLLADIEKAGGLNAPQRQVVIDQMNRLNEQYIEQRNLIRQLDSAQRKEAEQKRKDDEAKAAQAKIQEEAARQAERQIEARIKLFENLAEITADGENSVRSLNNQMAALTMGTLEQELLRIKEEQQAITESANAMAYALYEAGSIGYDEYLTQLREVLALEDQIIKKRQEGAQQLHEQQRMFSTGWKQAYIQYAEDAADGAKHAKDAFSTFTGGMEDAMVKFVQTGKLSFKDLINDMIAQMVRLLTQKAIVALFGGGGGLFSNIFGGAFADGGRPPVGKVSLVGERGPELFVPNTAGTIIPNHELGMSGGGAPVTNNYITNNISAIDSKSVAQLFAENRKTLLGTVQMAQREMPY